MEHDHRILPTELTSIHINLAEQAIEFEDQHGTVGRLRFTGETVLYEGEPLLLTPTPALDVPSERSSLPAGAQHRSQRSARPSQNSPSSSSRSRF